MPSDNLEEYLEDSLDVLRTFTTRDGETEMVLHECLFCGRPNKMYVNIDRLKFNCFAGTCGARGSLVNLIMAIEDCDLSGAVLVISRLARGIARARPLSELGEMFKAFKEGTLDDLSGLSDLSVPLPEEFKRCRVGGRWRVPKYLTQERRLKKSVIQRWGIGYCERGLYRGRAVVPVECAGMTSFVARDMTGEAAQKYLNPGINQSQMLFGYDELEEGKPVVAVEGVFDAIRLWVYGYQAVAYFGDSLRPAQVALLRKKSPSELILLPDPNVYVAVAMAAADMISEFEVVKLAKLSEGDPDSAPRHLVCQSIDQSPRVLDNSMALLAGLSSLNSPW